MAREVYWDSRTFIGLIQKESGRHADALAVWREGEQGKMIIYTSFFKFSKVFKVKCDLEKAKPLSEEGDSQIEAVLCQDFIKNAVVDDTIGKAVRRIMRLHPECKKSSDAIYLATALRLNVEEMHTWDGADLLKLSGRVHRRDGRALMMCPPYPLPSPAAPAPPAQHDLLDYTPLEERSDEWGQY